MMTALWKQIAIVATALACVSLACTDRGTTCDPSDKCCLATHDQGIGRECSPSNPCSPNLDCAYAEGCVEPKGTCVASGRCNDSGINIPVCKCEGGTGQSRFVPISAYGDACAP